MMWRDQQEALATRRQLLMQRSAALRARLGEEAQALQKPLAAADKVHGGIDWLAAHPYWLGVGALVPMMPLLLKPVRLLRWAVWPWRGWRLWRQVRGFLPASRQPVR